MYLRQIWVDPRLKFTDRLEDVESISLSDGLINQLWKPDGYFTNSKSETVHLYPANNAMFRVYKTGKVFYSIRYFDYNFHST